jgi:glycosyltransferase EpsF
MKRILLTFDKGLSHGGVQSVIMSIVRGLKNEYVFDVLVNTSQQQYFDEEFLSYGGKILRVPFYEGDSVFRTRADYYIRGFYLYNNVLSTIKKNMPYDAIHCNNVYESGLIVKAAKKCGIPVRLIHSHAIPCWEPWIRDKLNQIYMSLARKNATEFLGCSRLACDGLFGQQIASKVIYNSFDDNKFFFSDKGEHDENKIVIAQVGRFDSIKNQNFTLKIVKEILKKNIDVSLLLIGSDSGSAEQKLRETAETLGIINKVLFYKTDADIPSLLSLSDAFVFPSISEGFGTALIEAQAVGVQCYASDKVPKDTNCGGCKYISLNKSPEEWANLIIKDFYDSCGKHQSYDCSKFKPSIILKQYKELYG